MIIEGEVKLVEEDAIERLDAIAKSHQDTDMRHVAAVAAGNARSIHSLVDILSRLGASGRIVVNPKHEPLGD